MSRIAPFRFTNLPKISAERIKLATAMSHCLPGPRWEENFRELLGNTLRKYIRGKRQLTLSFQITNDDNPEEQFERTFAAGEKDNIWIGRNSSSEIHLNSRVVSSQHARIVANKGGFYVIDQSANGTYINNRQIATKTPTPLNNGDLISIYPFQIIFSLSQSVSNEDINVGFKIESLQEFTFSEVLRKLSSPIPLAILGIEPAGRKAILEIDPNFIIDMVEQIFGNEGNTSNKLLRGLSNIETGVVEFLILRIIKALSDNMVEFSGVTLRLEQLLIQGSQTLKNVEAVAEAGEPVLQLCTRFAVSEAVGYLNLYLPYGLLSNITRSQVSEDNQLDLLRSCLPYLESIKTQLVTEIGQIALNTNELASLEASDIVLLPDARLKFYGTELSGEIDVRLGLWGELCFNGDIITEDSAIKVILNGATRNPSPHSRPDYEKGNNMSRRPDNQQDEDQNDLASSAEYVQAVPVTVVVELGRRNMTVADVTRLRLGQIIDLRRTPSEPVELTIDGKSIGKGELVDIEGELGVRILRLFK